MTDARHTATTELQRLDHLRAVLVEHGPTSRARATADSLAEVFADILAAPYNVQALLLQPTTDALKQILDMEGHNDDRNNDQ